jgi:hypothetical protein
MASHRRTAAAATAVILASVSLYPNFSGLFWFWNGCGAVVVMALTGTATRLRRLPVAVIVLLDVAVLLLYLNLAFSNARSLFHLLPTPASLAALWDTAGQGFTEASNYAPPVPEFAGIMVLAAAGIGIAAMLTDLIAVRLGSAALAGLPLLLLFTEPFTLSVSRGFFGTAIAFCASVAGYLALLSSEGRDRIREWEHPNPPASDEPDTRTLAAAGRRVGFASVVLALCLPLFIPGLHTTRLLGGQPGIGGSGGSGIGGLGTGRGAGFPNPNMKLTQELHTPRASDVLVYTTSDSTPDYLQLYTVDRLTDSGWQFFGQPESLVPASPRLPAPPGLTAASSVARQTTTIVLGSVGQDQFGALPVPYPAMTVAAKGTLRADKSTLMVFDADVSLAGLKYTVTSIAESPPEQLLRSAPRPPADITSHYLSVPSAYGSLRALAASVARAAGAKTPFDDAIALQYWLAEGSFTYSLNAPTVLDASGLTKFLTVTKKGYCQQFSFAMAVLARLLGIPSRVAYGFTSGTALAGNSYLVTTHDAHAWPELYFQGYGWLRFEPTPSGSNGQGTASQPSYTLELGDPATAGRPETAPHTAPTSRLSGNGLPPNLRPYGAYGGQDGPAGGSSGTISPWEIFGLVVAGLIVIAAATPWCARRVIRRRRWRRRPAGTARTGAVPGTARADRATARDIAWAHAAWEELRDDLADYGASTLPSESPRAAAARAGARLSLADPARAALGRIAMAEERARYAPGPADGSGLRADSAVARRAIAAAVPRRARWRARLLPASVLRPALAAFASAADLYRGSRGGRLLRRNGPAS